MAFRYPISLLGTILFRGNKGGGLTLLQSYLDNHGSVWFENNYAMNGGGVEMRDSSFVSTAIIKDLEDADINNVSFS